MENRGDHVLIPLIWPPIIFFMNLFFVMLCVLFRNHSSHKRKTVASIFMDKLYYTLLFLFLCACLLPRSNCLTTVSSGCLIIVILLLTTLIVYLNRKYMLNFKVNAACLILFCTSISFYYCRNMISPEWCMVICFVALIIILVLFRMYSK